MTTITVIAPPSPPPSNKPFRIHGTFTPHYTTPPTLYYADDTKAPGKATGIAASSPKSGTISVHWTAPPAVYSPLPAGSTVMKGQYHFRHPGLSPGHHTVYVTDGTSSGSVGFGVGNAAHARVNPFER